MSEVAEQRRIEVGTTGWTADDLDDPEFERFWDSGRYEIVEGVLASMAAAYLDGSLPLQRLIRIVERHLDRNGLPGEFASEADAVVGRRRVPRPDAVFLTPDDLRRQAEANAARRGRRPLRLGRLLVPPTLVIESVSIGHEEHDRDVKRNWYAGFGVPNYWILDAFERTLDCLVLEGAAYLADQSGRDAAEVRPRLFPGLVIPLDRLWTI